MSEMVERIARLLAAQSVWRSYKEEGGNAAIYPGDLPWYVERAWPEYVVDTRDVIAAMRELTEEMRKAAIETGELHGELYDERPEVVWQSMIDAALAAKDPE